MTHRVVAAPPRTLDAIRQTHQGVESTPRRVVWPILRGMPPRLRRRKSPEATDVPSGASVAVADGPPAGKPADATPEPGPEQRPRAVRRRTLAQTTPVLLLRAAHPRQALITATGLAVAAALSGRPGREVGLVFATVLVGQAILGWHNDLVDRRRDARRLPSGKPVADGYLDPGTAWFALTCAVLLVVPLAVSNGVTAGSAYLGSLALGLMSNVVLRRGLLSWVPWAAAFALYPVFLSYGGWGGEATGSPPETAMVVLAALLGIGVHLLCALPGLVADHEDGHRHLALRLALKIGATRLLVATLAWTVLDVVGLLIAGNSSGLSR
jgi:hypothetical protein